jgi:hypothetical protein
VPHHVQRVGIHMSLFACVFYIGSILTEFFSSFYLYNSCVYSRFLLSLVLTRSLWEVMCWVQIHKVFVDGQLNEVVESLKDNEPLLDSVLVHMGSMYSTLGKFEKSLLVYRRSIDMLENRYGNWSLNFHIVVVICICCFHKNLNHNLF